MGAALVVAHREHRRGDRRTDVRAGCDRNRPDAAARHRQALAGSHPDRLRQGGLCAVVAGGDLAASSRCCCHALRGTARSVLIGFGTDPQFIFLAVLLPVLAGEIIKWIVGRGRPFVGGKANAFNFAHFAGTEAYASFPSAHAITAFALAFAVSAVWPRARSAMIVYAVLIGASRLVLLGPSSERRGCGSAGRRGRRDAGAILVRGSPARLRNPPRWRNCAARGTLAGPPQKGCPQGVRPIRSGRRQTPLRTRGSGGRSTQT